MLCPFGIGMDGTEFDSASLTPYFLGMCTRLVRG